MVFREHGLAHRLLQGLTGLEIGASAQNPFGLKSRNVAPLDDFTFYASHQASLGITPAKVDIWAMAHAIPVPDHSEDFILSSHVVEHIPNLVQTLIEWNRIVRDGGIIFLIVPLRDAHPADQGRPITPLQHFIDDYQARHTVDSHPTEGVPGGRMGHYHVFTPDSLLELVNWMACEGLLNWELVEREDIDTKVGNGFTLVFRARVAAKAVSIVSNETPVPTLAESKRVLSDSVKRLSAITPPIGSAFRIGLFGTFEVANYGDLLFPAIFRRMAAQHIPSVDLRLYSPDAGTFAFDETPIEAVHRLADSSDDLDALVFGGGEIARFDPAAWVKSPHGRCGYADLAILPAMLANAKGIPFAWNAPGIPPGLTRDEANVLAATARLAHYLAVRDERSAQELAEHDIPARVVPDSGFLLADAYPRQDLKDIHGELTAEFALPRRYLTAHLSPATAEPDEFQSAAHALARLARAEHVTVLLLPLGPLHGELAVLQTMAARHPAELTCLPGSLHPLEWAALLAHSELHVGSGLHGNITAYAYGVPTVVVHSRTLPKLQRLIELTESPVLTDWSLLSRAAESARAASRNDERRGRIRGEVYAHFEAMFDTLQSRIIRPDCRQELRLTSTLTQWATRPAAAVEWQNAESLNRLIQQSDETKQLLGQRTRQLNEASQRIVELSSQLVELQVNRELHQELHRELQHLKDVQRREQASLGKRWLDSIRVTRDYVMPEGHRLRGVYRVARGIVDRSTRFVPSTWKAIRSGRAALGRWRSRWHDRQRIGRLAERPLISILTPVYNVDERWLLRMFESIRAQRYPHWELQFVNDASTTPHIRPLLDRFAAMDSRVRVSHRPDNGGIVAASNDALERAQGDFCGLVDHDDELTDDALFEMVDRIQSHADLDVIYSDEDKIREDGTCFDPVRKPGWNPGLLLSCNYITHFSVFRTSLLRSLGGFRPQLDGSQDYDVLLRATEQARRIAHIPRILYHWRVCETSTASSATAKPYAYTAAVRALGNALERRGLSGEVEMRSPGIYRTRLRPAAWPDVVVVLAGFKDRDDAIAAAHEIAERTEYPHLELVIVQPGTTPMTTRIGNVATQFLPQFEALKERCPSTLFAFATSVIRPTHADWLTAMVEQSARPDVGIVGAKVLTADGFAHHTGLTLGTQTLLASTSKFVTTPSINQAFYTEMTRDCIAVAGGCVLIRSEAWRQLGESDQRMESESDQIRISLLIRNNGWSAVYTPFAVLQNREAIRSIPLETHLWAHLLPPHDPYFSPALMAEYRKSRRPDPTPRLQRAG
jgi:polysaccharide pyruvyl transferase WcaK-like protein/GT2 family glycosyltransferase/SAM-dependent methyltransferase